MTVSEEFIKQAEIVLAERDRYKAESDAKTEALKAKDEQIAALRGLLQVQEQISKSWQEAAIIRSTVISTDDKIMLRYDQEIARLRSERDAARRGQRAWGIVGFILGGALGWAAQK